MKTITTTKAASHTANALGFDMARRVLGDAIGRRSGNENAPAGTLGGKESILGGGRKESSPVRVKTYKKIERENAIAEGRLIAACVAVNTRDFSER